MASADGVAATMSRAFSSIRGVAVPHSVLSILAGLFLWEVAVRWWAEGSLVVVAPSQIASEFLAVAESGELWPHLAASAKSFLIGFIGCMLIAIPLGLATGASRHLFRYVNPWVGALYATPNIALAPLLIIWLGFGTSAKAAIVALAAFFPMVINTIGGVRTVDRELREVAVVYKANRWETFRRILFPGALPFILTGLRLAVGRALVGLIIGDLFGARAGLGLMLLEAAQFFQTAKVFVVTAILAGTGILLSALIGVAERRTMRSRGIAEAF